MSTHVIAEYVEEGFVILQDGRGSYIFNQEDSILPIEDDHPLSLRTIRPKWNEEKIPRIIDPGFREFQNSLS